MASGWVHTIFRESFWVLEVEGAGPITRHQTKREAIEAGRDAARVLRTDHVVHHISGDVAERSSYAVHSPPPAEAV